MLPKEAWDLVRRIAHARNGNRCMECDEIANLECHEAWEYCWIRRNAKNVPVMRLVGLHSLCHLCHMGKHRGCAKWKGEPAQVKAHLLRTHTLTESELEQLIHASNEKVKTLKFNYELDLSYLNDEVFAVVHQCLGRKLGTNEIKNCQRVELS